MNKEQVLDFLKDNKEEFSNKYQISALALFGSLARGDNTSDSDIDIAIETKLSDYFKLYDFKEELEKQFHSKVDVVRLREHMNPLLKSRIRSEGIYVR
ncbi:MAG TPA: nucleotidyltransferase [Arcobacter sp.]|nr:nucleotidyltransferase [Arcobacter sp.]